MISIQIVKSFYILAFIYKIWAGLRVKIKITKLIIIKSGPIKPDLIENIFFILFYVIFIPRIEKLSCLLEKAKL